MRHASFVVVLIVKSPSGIGSIVSALENFIDPAPVNVCRAWARPRVILKDRLFTIVYVIRGRRCRSSEDTRDTAAQRVVRQLIRAPSSVDVHAADRTQMCIVDVCVENVLIARQLMLSTVAHGIRSDVPVLIENVPGGVVTDEQSVIRNARAIAGFVPDIAAGA